MSSHFYISDTNPNAAGMGGCACHPGGCATCKGPFAVFPEGEMEGVGSPVVVLSVQCASEVVDKGRGAILNQAVKEKYGTDEQVLIPGATFTPEVDEPSEEDLERRAEIAEAAREDSEPEGIRDPQTGENTGAEAKDVFQGLS